MSIKRKIINAAYRLKYADKNLSIGKKAYILGRTSAFEGYNRIGDGSKFYGSMGYGSYIGENSKINATIGRYCCIADRVYTVSGTHPVNDFVSIHPAFYSTSSQAGFTYTNEDKFEETLFNKVDGKTSVYIGNDVWIGCNVILLGGIKIGDGAIIAAGAIVTQDVEPYAIVGGVPAKLIRKRFSQEQIDFLGSFCWWDKDPDWLKDNCENMDNIEKFIEKHIR